ncbi:glycerophosphodiester phosphodiesterase family protein [Bacillus sp. SIMBA_074]|uniref:glycerophosphodiester phosphodiesterase family protein n=2 Tax=Bacillati TaxID=1783272 RepID=UPI00397884AD
MIFKTYEITVDLIKDAYTPEVIRFSQNDLNSAKLLLNLTKMNEELDLSLAKSVRMSFKKPDGTRVFQNDCQPINPLKGKYQIVLKTQTLAAAGDVIAQVHIEEEDRTIDTQAFYFKVSKSLASDEAIESTNEFGVIQKIIEANEKLEGVDVDALIESKETADSALAKSTENTNQIGILSKKLSIKVGEVEAIAHRGCAGIAPENTMIAYSIATLNGFDSWECDVQISSDGIPVVIHDSTVNRTTNGTGNVKDMTLAQLKALDASKARPYFTGVTIPTFEEWLSASRGNSKYIYPEIKGYRSQTDIALMVDLIVKYGWENATIMQSFIASDLTKVRELNSKITIGYLVGTEAKFLEMLDLAASDGNAVMLSDYNVLLNKPSLVELSRSKGVDVGAWTIDNAYILQKIKSIGITRFMSNRIKEAQ